MKNAIKNASSIESYEQKLLDIAHETKIERLVARMLRSPLTKLTSLTNNTYLKDELSTPSSSFKYRGASLIMSRILECYENGIVATSTGNHGLSLAILAKQASVPLTVYMPMGTQRERVERIESYGSKVIIAGQDLSETIAFAKEAASSHKASFISSTDEHLAVGHSTLLREALLENRNLEALYFPIGVGSGISGQILSKIVTGSSIKIIGVVHKSSPAWKLSLESGLATYSPCDNSLAPGIRISQPQQSILNFISKHLNSIVEIDDSDLKNACAWNNSIISNDLTTFCSIAAHLKCANFKRQTLIVKC